MTEYERVREQITQRFQSFAEAIEEGTLEGTELECQREAKEILSLVEIKSDDQSLPNADKLKAELKKQGGYHTARTMAYAICQQDMLKVGFIKVIPKEEYGS